MDQCSLSSPPPPPLDALDALASSSTLCSSAAPSIRARYGSVSFLGTTNTNAASTSPTVPAAGSTIQGSASAEPEAARAVGGDVAATLRVSPPHHNDCSALRMMPSSTSPHPQGNSKPRRPPSFVQCRVQDGHSLLSPFVYTLSMGVGDTAGSGGGVGGVPGAAELAAIPTVEDTNHHHHHRNPKNINNNNNNNNDTPMPASGPATARGGGDEMPSADGEGRLLTQRPVPPPYPAAAPASAGGAASAGGGASTAAANAATGEHTAPPSSPPQQKYAPIRIRLRSAPAPCPSATAYSTNHNGATTLTGTSTTCSNAVPFRSMALRTCTPGPNTYRFDHLYCIGGGGSALNRYHERTTITAAPIAAPAAAAAAGVMDNGVDDTVSSGRQTNALSDTGTTTAVTMAGSAAQGVANGAGATPSASSGAGGRTNAAGNRVRRLHNNFSSRGKFFISSLPREVGGSHASLRHTIYPSDMVIPTATPPAHILATAPTTGTDHAVGGNHPPSSSGPLSSSQHPQRTAASSSSFAPFSSAFAASAPHRVLSDNYTAYGQPARDGVLPIMDQSGRFLPERAALASLTLPDDLLHVHPQQSGAGGAAAATSSFAVAAAATSAMVRRKSSGASSSEPPPPIVSALQAALPLHGTGNADATRGADDAGTASMGGASRKGPDICRVWPSPRAPPPAIAPAGPTAATTPRRPASAAPSSAGVDAVVLQCVRQSLRRHRQEKQQQRKEQPQPSSPRSIVTPVRADATNPLSAAAAAAATGTPRRHQNRSPPLGSPSSHARSHSPAAAAAAVVVTSWHTRHKDMLACVGRDRGGGPFASPSRTPRAVLLYDAHTGGTTHMTPMSQTKTTTDPSQPLQGGHHQANSGRDDRDVWARHPATHGGSGVYGYSSDAAIRPHVPGAIMGPAVPAAGPLDRFAHKHPRYTLPLHATATRAANTSCISQQFLTQEDEDGGSFSPTSGAAPTSPTGYIPVPTVVSSANKGARSAFPFSSRGQQRQATRAPGPATHQSQFRSRYSHYNQNRPLSGKF